MTKLIRAIKWKYGKPIETETEESKKPLFYLNKELEFINFSETTALCNFVDIKFKGENKVFTEDINRLNYLWIEKEIKQNG